MGLMKLSSRETRLIVRFRTLPAYERRAILKFIASLARLAARQLH